VRTLGIGLAADPKRTAAVAIDWNESSADCSVVEGGDDETLVAAMLHSDKVGVDAPFGWPVDFVRSVTTHTEGGPWPDCDREKLRYRLTDRAVRQRFPSIVPLSASSDRIAVTAMRCAALTTRWETTSQQPVDRTGRGRLAEVYPAASLAAWGLNHKGYKGKHKLETLRLLVDQVAASAGIDAPTIAVWDDNIFDAWVASLTARVLVLGRTVKPTSRELSSARVEGWIHVPEPGPVRNSLFG